MRQINDQTEDGRDPQLIVLVWIPLTVRSRFGASLTLGSGVIVCQKYYSDTAIFGNFHVLSDAAPYCFSEATLGEFSATSGSSIMDNTIRGSMILQLRVRLSLS